MAYDWLPECHDLPPLLEAALAQSNTIVDSNEIADDFGMPFNPDAGHRPSGVWMYQVVRNADMDHSWDPFRPKGWCRFGSPAVRVISPPEDDPEAVPTTELDVRMGDVLYFEEDDGKAFVAVCFGEDETHYHVIGVAGGLEASVSRQPKSTFKWARRPVGYDYPPPFPLENDGTPGF